MNINLKNADQLNCLLLATRDTDLFNRLNVTNRDCVATIQELLSNKMYVNVVAKLSPNAMKA